MKAQRLESLPVAPAAARIPARPPAEVFAQRHSTLGGGSVSAPPILDSGRPLEPATRHDMERGFGRDFGAIRIHDDARAHDNARSLGALAYAAGNDIVFGQGRYAPETPAGRALIAHELAHSVQQSGVQMKADGPVPEAADARLEAEADRAALAVTAGRPAPSLTRIGAPAVFRADAPVPTGEPAADAEPKTVSEWPAVEDAKKGTESPGLPEGFTVLKEDVAGPGSTALVLSHPKLILKTPKGSGAWVAGAYQAAASGGSLIYDPVFNGGSVAAVMEKSPDYKKAWLGNYGFTTLQEVETAIRAAAVADPAIDTLTKDSGVAFILEGFKSGDLSKAECDIDHIVEKQLKGGSNPSNLQLLTAKTNQLSGSLTAVHLSGLAKSVRDTRTKLTKLQIRFEGVEVTPGDTDASVKVEDLLRSGKVKGDAAVKQRVGGAPVALLAGGKQEVVSVLAAGSTPMDLGGKRLISGLMLTTYTRGTAKGADTVKAKVSSKPMVPSDKPVVLDALRVAAPTLKEGETGDLAGGAAGEAKAAVAAAGAAGEYRQLKLNTALNKDLEIYYPYLSPGKLTSLAVDENGGLTGTGVISPRIKFLGDIKFSFAPDSMKADAPLDVSKFKSPIPLIRFTGGSISLELAPTLKPEGVINFAIGPAAKPLLLGEVKTTAEGGAFVATGTLKPAMALPGISEASGTVRYHSDTGWSGSLSAKSVGKLPNSTVTADLGFKEEAGKFIVYANGGITTQVKDKTLSMTMAWTEKTGIVYSGGFDWEKPFPIVDKVAVKGTYSDDELKLQGTSSFTFRQWTGSLQVHYHQKDGQPGKLWGAGSVAVETKNKKGKGKLGVKVSETGELTGSGEIAYQLTDKIKPLLGVTLSAGGHLRINGAVEIGNVELFSKWPEGDKGKRTLMSASPSFKFPTPVPGLNAAVNIHASVGVSFSIGPGHIRKVVLAGSFDPLEENPNVTATLKGDFVIPTKFSLYGQFGAELAAEIAGGLAGIAGGLEVVPSVSLAADAIAAFEAKYDQGEFAFDGKAYLEAQLKAKLGINLTATIYGLYHALEYRWRYPVAAVEKQLGPSIVINLGKVSYSTAKGMTWPSLGDISIEPKNLDPLDMVKQLLNEKSEKETTA